MDLELMIPQHNGAESIGLSAAAFQRLISLPEFRNTLPARKEPMFFLMGRGLTDLAPMIRQGIQLLLPRFDPTTALALARPANPNVTIDVNGYCDAIGSVEYNLKLSDRRADSVVDYLVKAGIPESRLVPHGFGKTNFVATNDSAEGRAQNRRVELVPTQ